MFWELGYVMLKASKVKECISKVVFLELKSMFALEKWIFGKNNCMKDLMTWLPSLVPALL
jgi:hypothetical protein